MYKLTTRIANAIEKRIYGLVSARSIADAIDQNRPNKAEQIERYLKSLKDGPPDGPPGKQVRDNDSSDDEDDDGTLPALQRVKLFILQSQAFMNFLQSFQNMLESKDEETTPENSRRVVQVNQIALEMDTKSVMDPNIQTRAQPQSQSQMGHPFTNISVTNMEILAGNNDQKPMASQENIQQGNDILIDIVRSPKAKDRQQETEAATILTPSSETDILVAVKNPSIIGNIVPANPDSGEIEPDVPGTTSYSLKLKLVSI
jgi:hypothetical protein